MTQLLTHPFLREATGRTQPTFLRAYEHVRRNVGREAEAQEENRTGMSAAERYETRVLRRTLGLLGTVRALEDARRMIAVFPTQLTRGEAPISRDRWVDYHFGYFTVSLASLPDIAVVLTATVFRLGLAMRHCTADVVITHDYVRGTETASALRGLGKAAQGVKDRRNRHVHRGEHAEVDDLASDSFLRDLKAITFIRSVNPEFSSAAFVRSAWREATKEIVQRLDGEATQVDAALGKVFDALHPEFTRRSDALRQLDAVSAYPAA